MTWLDHKCSFCHKYLIPAKYESYSFVCHDCNVEVSINDHHRFAITYRLNDPDIFALIMHLDTEFTILAFNNDSPLRDRFKHPRLTIKGIWPDTKPQDALNLAKRILKLLIFQ